MRTRYSAQCPNHCNFAAYVTGTATGHAAKWIEHHLTGCECCFESFINAFNQYLDQASVRMSEVRHEEKKSLSSRN
jgi:hypothetical protein